MLNQIESTVKKIRETKPLVLNLTNYVTMEFMANCLLALGAAPIMSESKEELPELINISSSINLNIGTLNNDFMERARIVVTSAKSSSKPIILDPVGCGASQIRTKASREFLPYAAIVRGNASEIMALFGEDSKTLGVESTHQTNDALSSSQKLASKHKLVVTVSGETDLIVGSNRHESLKFGSSLMPYVTGMGCTLTAVIAAFRAVCPDSFEAAKLGTAYYGLCGNLAAESATSPGSFREKFIDFLHSPNFKAMEKYYA